MKWLFLILGWLAAVPVAACPAGAEPAIVGEAGGDLRSELAAAKAAGQRGLLVLFELEGCVSCAELRKSLGSSAVSRYYRKHFRIVTLDAAADAALVDLRGRATRVREFAQANQVVGTPTLVFYDLAGLPVSRFVGRHDAPALLRAGRYVASAAYENVPFSRYR